MKELLPRLWVSQLARVEAELEFQYDLSAIEPATEEQMIVGSAATLSGDAWSDGRHSDPRG